VDSGLPDASVSFGFAPSELTALPLHSFLTQTHSCLWHAWSCAGAEGDLKVEDLLAEIHQQKEAKTRVSLVGYGQGWRVFAPAQRV
jgi:hypothetical protein